MTVKVLTLASSPSDYLKWFDLSSRPLLELAWKNAAPAYNPRIEWIVDRFEDGVIKHRVLHNYTQILRVPFRPKPKENGRLETFAEAAVRGGNLILDQAESTLWFGRPLFDVNQAYPLSMCGGVMHYLRRRVYENDSVALRELRPLTLIDHRSLYDVGAHGEWLWEFSLQVNPGHYQRGMTPVCLPPAPQPVKALGAGRVSREGVIGMQQDLTQNHRTAAREARGVEGTHEA